MAAKLRKLLWHLMCGQPPRMVQVIGWSLWQRHHQVVPPALATIDGAELGDDLQL